MLGMVKCYIVCVKLHFKPVGFQMFNKGGDCLDRKQVSTVQRYTERWTNFNVLEC